MKENASTPTSVLKFICPHEERASYSTLICLPVVSATYDQVSVKACPRCVSFMVGQGLTSLESTYHQISTGKSVSDF